MQHVGQPTDLPIPHSRLPPLQLGVLVYSKAKDLGVVSVGFESGRCRRDVTDTTGAFPNSHCSEAVDVCC